MEYFLKVAEIAKKTLDALPIALTPQPLDYSLNFLEGKIDEIRKDVVVEMEKINFSKKDQKNLDIAIGLNTVGMLLDRFTILLVKEWCIRNKNSNPEKADLLFETQTKEIIKALDESNKGYSSVNSKITNIQVNVNANSWEEAFFELFFINLKLWESQEVLYIKDISKLPAEELRDYIKWFANGNMQRNVLIEIADNYFWQKYELQNSKA
ncbi:MAG: hypothetical protein EOP00_09410 [Pedobacter sp.]|nr:MAG: hypothetical protein EOP00_09410 [Pedobacter sp.]